MTCPKRTTPLRFVLLALLALVGLALFAFLEMKRERAERDQRAQDETARKAEYQFIHFDVEPRGAARAVRKARARHGLDPV